MYTEARGSCNGYIKLSAEYATIILITIISTTITLIHLTRTQQNQQTTQTSSIKMQFFATAAILAVAGIASAAETVSIADFSARKNDGALQATSFKIQPAAAECSSTAAADIVYPRMTQCGNSLYHFQIKQGEGNAFSVTLTKETGMKYVVYGSDSTDDCFR